MPQMMQEPEREPQQDMQKEQQLSDAERVRRLQARLVMSNVAQIRKQVPELPPYIALSHTVNKMVVANALTPEEYLRWTSGLMGAIKKPLHSAN